MDDMLRKVLKDEVKREFPGFIQMLESCFDFKQWSFHQIFSEVVTQFPPSVICESEWCRIRFMWQIPDRREKGATISVKYGRLHAPIDQAIMVWNGKRCYCWHDVNNAVNFLDGLSPQETVYLRSKWPRVMAQFQESNSSKNLTQPEWLARMHATVWKHYGQRLFELFDLRRPDLWDQYSIFVTECCKIDPGPFVPGLPADYDIC